MNYVKNLTERYPELSVCAEAVQTIIDAIDECHKNGGKVLLCGNGGSAADCEHISGEFLKGFLQKRPYPTDDPAFDGLQQGIPAIPLTSLTASLSAFANDVDPDLCYAQLTGALGKEGDVFIGISTSGNAKNVSAAATVAKKLGIKTFALTGAGGGRLAEICDATVKVPETETYKIQELHLPVYHAICAQCEEDIYGA